MKKITLVTFLLLGWVFSTSTLAQTLNQNASWPNPAWSVEGTYSANVGALEANPTVDANFAFDDDDAGSGNNDFITAQSPVIDLTAAFNAGEIWLTITANYVYYYLANDELLFQYWDADANAWVNWGPSFDALGTTTTLTNNFCTGTSQTYTSPVLDITDFTATQLSGFRYRIAYDDDPAGADWNYGFCFQSPTIVSETPPADILDYYNLQFPAVGNINAGDPFDVYAQAYEAGLTDVTSGQAPGIEAWFGYSVADTDPSGGGWTWVPATFNVEAGNNDEYTLNLAASITSSGTYYYASRWRLNGGFYTYGGIQSDASYGGIWGEDNNVSGVLTINPPANDECANAVVLTVNPDYSCGDVTAGTIVGATNSGADDATCGGTPDDDVWYSFVATSTMHRVSLINQTGSTTDMYMAFYNAAGGCGALGGSVACSDPQTANLTGLTIGNTYYIQVYTWTATPGQTSAFDICVGTPPPPPANDTCEGALALTESQDSSCANAVTGTTVSALPSASGTCSTAGKDVWYSFTPTTTGNYNIAVAEITDYGFSSTYVTIYSGACGTTTQIGSSCTTTSMSNVALTASTPYYIVVRSTSTTTGVDFSLCAYPSPPPPANDLCADAVSLVCDQPINGTSLFATGGNATSCIGSIGNDVWYQYSGNDSTVELTVTSTTTNEEPQVEVFSSTDGACSGFTTGSNTCYESAGGGENPTVLSFEASEGTEYFIRVGNWINGNPGIDFTISATCTPFPECGLPTDLDADVTDVTADISWLAPAAGTPVGYNWEVQPDGVAQGTAGALDSGSTAGTSDTAIGLTPQTAYDLYVQTDCGVDGTSDWSGPYSFTTAATPPANDECENATALTVNADYACGVVTAGTTVGATASSQVDDVSGTPNNDVWFSFVAANVGHRVSLINVVAIVGTATDMGIGVYDGTGGCDALVFTATSDPNTINLTGLTVGEIYYVRVYGWASGTGTAQTNFDVCVGTPPPPPANDDCANAVPLTPGLTYDENPLDGTVAGATLNGETSGCGVNGPGVWYSLVVPADGNITIETGPDTSTGTTTFDSVIEAFSGSCGSLTSIECDDDDAVANNFSILNLTGLTPGETIYIRVWEYSGDESEPFSISAYSATLSTGEVELNSFTYFPNPVKNELNLRAQSNIQNVTIFNMVGQEVLRVLPNSITSDVDMSALQTGAYFVKVTINEVTETIRVIKQ